MLDPALPPDDPERARLAKEIELQVRKLLVDCSNTYMCCSARPPKGSASLEVRFAMDAFTKAEVCEATGLLQISLVRCLGKQAQAQLPCYQPTRGKMSFLEVIL